MARRLDTGAADFEAAFAELLSGVRTRAAGVGAAVARIIADVRSRGDAALCDYTARWDRFEITPDRLRIGENEIAASADAAPAEAMAALGVQCTLIAGELNRKNREAMKDMPKEQLIEIMSQHAIDNFLDGKVPKQNI